jgi:hypothetical protein
MQQPLNKTNVSSSIGLFLFIVVLTAKYHQTPSKVKRSLPILVAMLEMFTFSDPSNMKIAGSDPVRGKDVRRRPSITTALLHCGCYSTRRNLSFCFRVSESYNSQ